MNDTERKLVNSAETIAPPETDGRQMLNRVKSSIATKAPAKKERSFWQRGIGAVTAAALALAVIAPVGVAVKNYNALESAIGRLSGTYVDMEGVTAFGVWNAPTEKKGKSTLSSLAYIKASAEETNETDEELQDWESDYDWDPTKANVLVSMDESGNLKEVVYERANARGQVRQDSLGNAAMVYVSDTFTYVMYVSDQEWEFWKNINFAQETVSPNGFHCHHEQMQTVVIHNETGKVFPLKDLIEQVSEISGTLNYTMQVTPTYNDYLYVHPMYGNLITQWYRVDYDEEKGVQYEYVRFEHENLSPESNTFQGVTAVCRDRYGQEYIYAKNVDVASLAKDSFYCTSGKSLLVNEPHKILQGSDGRMYTTEGGVLQIFGENFELTPVEEGTTVSLESLAEDLPQNVGDLRYNEGICYRLEENYLYSMFGEVWQIQENGVMERRENLQGDFVREARDGCLIGGEIIAFTGTRKGPYNGGQSIDGTVVKLSFGLKDGAPSVTSEKIIEANEIWVKNHRMVISQYESSNTGRRTKYFLLKVENGSVYADYVAYGDNGGIEGLTKPITEPLNL